MRLTIEFTDFDALNAFNVLTDTQIPKELFTDKPTLKVVALDADTLDALCNAHFKNIELRKYLNGHKEGITL